MKRELKLQYARYLNLMGQARRARSERERERTIGAANVVLAHWFVMVETEQAARTPSPQDD